ncbi:MULTISPECIES: ArsR/SmtB family transcription factor [Brevibacillus]|jgi:ArsR family transcriptional regulator|uniref:Putative HTH-type transcriptional regulator YceK n=1 Tax=Brevibacillus parabrevis TaxID=54914 RepID=A0A4Y3PPV2_BREPA|nr:MULTISPECIES: helix-turn-helix domain-containing protein [Brevibacillus]TGV07201.1 ArsR family transcriptional regulator [Mesorhizobium sp. M00.F.Ca.ET.186.01.1.1]KZE51925.1 ArsR family transcriptional regulator [Brevibacillus parabrevis]MBU8711033.1 helix-turn-helix domain-containing protein [Brevibacillus parabrevis]MDH6353271.1 ArsR family transcriptional regulator [Brevibacillus sp. 1238]MDR5002760.1 helix-turn-helix domain-containing protein [Brevibacillus parabrevis]
MTIKQSNEDEKRVKIFKALADVKRIEIVRFLYRAKAMHTCGHIGNTHGLNKSNTTYHLKILHDAELIDIIRDGQFKLIQLREETFQAFLPGYLDTL